MAPVIKRNIKMMTDETQGMKQVIESMMGTGGGKGKNIDTGAG